MRSGIARHQRCAIGLLAGIALISGACGSDDQGVVDPTDTRVFLDPPATTDGGPTTEAAPASEVPPIVESTAPAGPVPERIVSLSPTHTEMLFAIGASDLLVAVDDQSDYPPAALELPNELSGFEPSVEAIAAFDPDLVITGGDFTGLGEQLAQLGIEVWDGPAATSFDETYGQIEQLGTITGRSTEALELIRSMVARIDELVVDAPRPDEPLAIYHELDPTLYSADSSTFIGEIYALFGLRNIADQADGDSAFPQLNAEVVVAADPDIIFLADTRCCGQSAATVAARPGWDAITAVQTGNVVEMDDDIASRWGPRVVDYVEAVAAALAAAAPSGDGG